jgi:hypothetical protein
LLFLAIYSSIVVSLETCGSMACDLKHATCYEDQCVCDIFFSIESNCTIRWDVAHPNWEIGFIVYWLVK